MKKVIVGLTAAFVLLVPNAVSAHYTGGIDGNVTQSIYGPAFYTDVLGHGTYQGHLHYSDCINVKLQQELNNGSWTAVGNSATDCTPSSGILKATSTAQSCPTDFVTGGSRFRVKVWYRAWNASGILIASATEYPGQLRVSATCYP